jgi:site-specific DNA-methyltransferase (adenine-specific)
VQPVFKTKNGVLFHGDCLEVMAGVESGSVDLVFADPPFNLGKDYNSSKVNDSIAEDAYLAWCGAWIRAGVRVLAEGGSFFLYNLPKWNVELGHYLREEGMTFRHWIAIDMKTSLPIPGRLYPAHYSLLYYTKGKPKTFERPRVPIPACRHCGGDIKDYGGHRGKLNPEGLNLSDVWTDIPPVRHKSTMTRGANELAPKLLHRVLGISSKEGDLVLDPFGGAGTTYFVAEHTKRRWIGIELGDVDPIIRRLKGEPPNFEMPNRGDGGKGNGNGKPHHATPLFK